MRKHHEIIVWAIEAHDPAGASAAMSKQLEYVDNFIHNSMKRGEVNKEITASEKN